MGRFLQNKFTQEGRREDVLEKDTIFVPPGSYVLFSVILGEFCFLAQDYVHFLQAYVNTAACG